MQTVPRLRVERVFVTESCTPTAVHVYDSYPSTIPTASGQVAFVNGCRRPEARYWKCQSYPQLHSQHTWRFERTISSCSFLRCPSTRLSRHNPYIPITTSRFRPTTVQRDGCAEKRMVERYGGTVVVLRNALFTAARHAIRATFERGRAACRLAREAATTALRSRCTACHSTPITARAWRSRPAARRFLLAAGLGVGSSTAVRCASAAARGSAASTARRPLATAQAATQCRGTGCAPPTTRTCHAAVVFV